MAFMIYRWQEQERSVLRNGIVSNYGLDIFMLGKDVVIVAHGHPPPLTPIWRDTLVRRLVWLDDLVRNGLDEFFLSPGDAARLSVCRGLIQRYVTATEQLLVSTTAADVSHELAIVLMDVPAWVEDTHTGNIECFSVVGPEEADLECGRISFLSPMGRALLLQRVSDTVTFDTPEGRYAYRVVAVGRAP